MAAYAAVASLMNNIDQIMKHPLLSTSLDNKQIQPLVKRAGFLLDFIEGYNYGGRMNKEVEDLERRITCAAHAAEDMIESHIVDQIHADASDQPSLGCKVDLEHIIQDMDAILKNVAEVEENHSIKEDQHSTTPLMEQTGETAMVGFEDELIRLMDELTSQRSSRHVISIVGMGGTSKTTLAQNVYQNLLIKQHFDIRAWATVSQQYNVNEILSQLLSSLGKSSGSNVNELGEQLHKTLTGRRYLIILDNIWSVQVWDKVGRFFPDNGNGSRIVLTTRLSNVAGNCSSCCYTMKPLDEHISWKLFCKKAFEQEKCPYPELEKVGKEITRLCRGLPLSTVVIGGLLLKSPRTVEFWENVARNIKSNPDSKGKKESLDILSLSYNNLPPHLKPCFLYFGVFREDSEIRVSKIIKLWIAEGFLRPKNTHMLEEVAEGYLKELIDRNLILVSKRRQNGKIGCCGIHDLVRDLCLKVGKQQEFFHVGKGEIRGTGRRLICSDWPRPLHNGPQLTRSILARTSVEDPVKYKLLRVWDEGRPRPSEVLYGNANLRYLALKSYLHTLPRWWIPTSLSLMWNLQTLIITTSPLIVAPIGIWKMRQLRHVKSSSSIHLPHPPTEGDGFFMMDNLQTLTEVLNLRLSEEVCKIIPNIKKLHLLYDSKLHGYDDSLIDCVCNLDCLHKLESQRLIFRRVKYPELSEKVSFPISLNKLSLSQCQLGLENQSMIGSLPQLEVLELGCVIDKGEWSPIEGQFMRLKVLKVVFCNLYHWEADNSHFPVLRKLLLCSVGFLEEIPLGIGEIQTLELIVVHCCSESAAVSAVKIKEDQLENQGNDVLQIQVKMYDSYMKSFKDRLETEGLTINDIQLEIC